MKYPIIILLLALVLTTYVPAQSRVQMPNPLENLTKKQRSTLSTQANQFFAAAQPAVTQAAKSTVTISYRGTRLTYGTVVKSPRTSKNVILTKWSEIAKWRNNLVVTTPKGKYNRASLVGIYPEYDIAILKTDADLTPLNLAASATPELGDFVVLANPNGRVQSIGVVSVKARSLRETDKAFLGVLMNFQTPHKYGIQLERVVEQSPAARAGLRQGDVVIAVDQKTIKGAGEMRNTLQKLIPGSNVLIRYRRGNKERTANVQLGSRPQELDPSQIPKKRLNEMQRMGSVPSPIRTNFPNVIQSDMPVQADDTPDDPSDNFTNECGGPIVNLDGQVVGMLIARGSRIKSFIIPTSTLEQIILTQSATLQTQRGNQPQNETNTRKKPPRAIPIEE